MSLRVIDAASYQGNMPQKNMDFDALIVRATEGCSYINPYCDSEAQEALSLGKSWEYIISQETLKGVLQNRRQTFLLARPVGISKRRFLYLIGKTEIHQT